MELPIDAEQDDRVIPLKPIERKVSKKQQDHLQKARTARKVKKVSKLVEEKLVIDKIRPAIVSIVQQNPDLELKNIFMRLDKQLFTPATDPYELDQGLYESEEVLPSQPLKSKVVEPIATPETLAHINREHETMLGLNDAIERFGNNPVASQGIIFI